MGTWGTGPFDSDAAGDWFDGVDKYVLDKVGTALQEGSVDDSGAAVWYAAAGLLAGLESIKYGSYGDSDVSKLAVERLDQIIEAAPRMGWRDADDFVRDVEKVKAVLVASQQPHGNRFAGVVAKAAQREAQRKGLDRG
jgi:hypothetical protein